MTNSSAPATAELIAPLGNPAIQFVRNKYGVIIDSFGNYEARQSVDLWVEAHKYGVDGFVDNSETIKLTVGLSGPVKPLILDYLGLMLPGYELSDWQTWVEPSDESEPF